MIFIVGISPRHKPLGMVSCVCPACSGSVLAYLSKEYSVFTFFFIPIIPFGVSYLVSCPNCGSVMTLSKEKGRAFERGGSIVIYDSDLLILQNNAGPACPFCRAKIIVNQNFCYHCGAKF